MPTSSFYVIAAATIDYTHPTLNKHNYATVGDVSIGGSKVFCDRTLLSFNVESSPYSGRPLTPADTIVAAQLDAYVQGMAGAGGFACTLARNTRDDWNDEQATWNEYKTGSAWTAGGGDVDAAPAALAFTSPTTLAAYTIAGLAAFVVDAIALHAGVVQLRLRADDENGNHEFDLLADPYDSKRPRLVVSYTSPAVSETPIARPTHAPLRGPRPAPPARPVAPARPARAKGAAR